MTRFRVFILLTYRLPLYRIILFFDPVSFFPNPYLDKVHVVGSFISGCVADQCNLILIPLLTMPQRKERRSRSLSRSRSRSPAGANGTTHGKDSHENGYGDGHRSKDDDGGDGMDEDRDEGGPAERRPEAVSAES